MAGGAPRQRRLAIDRSSQFVASKGMDIDDAIAELDAVRGFVDFVNQQVGVYSDSLAGFEGNRARVEREIDRARLQAGQTAQEGQQVVVSASVDHPDKPDVLHHRIVRAADFISENAEAGFNEAQMCRSMIVFIYAFWNDKVRPRIATLRGVEPKDVRFDALDDLQTLRRNIIHNGGHLPEREHATLKVMGDLCLPDAPIAPTHEQMHNIFVAVKNAIGPLSVAGAGGLP